MKEYYKQEKRKRIKKEFEEKTKVKSYSEINLNRKLLFQSIKLKESFKIPFEKGFIQIEGDLNLNKNGKLNNFSNKFILEKVLFYYFIFKRILEMKMI
jgi:hypothetical protein